MRADLAGGGPALLVSEGMSMIDSDAFVQALQDDPTLHPHDVAIVSPDIERMAPYLRATFDRGYVDSDGRTCTIPLSIADRSLQRVDDGARVFVAMLDP